MAYIGNQPTSAPFVTDSYTGTGSQTAFVGLSFAPAATSSIAVFVNGVYQRPTIQYTVSGTILNFVSAPSVSTNITVLHLGVGAAATTVVADGSVTQAKLSPDVDFGINALFYTGT